MRMIFKLSECSTHYGLTKGHDNHSGLTVQQRVFEKGGAAEISSSGNLVTFEKCLHLC